MPLRRRITQGILPDQVAPDLDIYMGTGTERRQTAPMGIRELAGEDIPRLLAS